MIHVITGHICSGKSTYVREHAEAGSLVIDLDRIALALAPEGTKHHQYDNEIREVAIAVRWRAIDEAVILYRRGRIKAVWIVHAYPTDQDLGRYDRMGASVKAMRAEPDTLRARAAAERPLKMRQELEARLGPLARPKPA